MENRRNLTTNVTLSLHEFLIAVTAGATAGLLAKTVTTPFDRTIISFQISKTEKFSFLAAYGFLREMYLSEGFLGMWRGNSGNVFRVVPYATLQYVFYEQYSRLLMVGHESHTSRLFLAGALTGLTAQTITYPLDVCTARMLSTKKSDDARRFTQILYGIWRFEGWPTFYRGYLASITGIIPYSGLSFFTYHSLKRNYIERTGYRPNSFISCLFGAFAGGAGQTASYPLDIVRRRKQTMPAHDEIHKMSVLRTLRVIARTEGIRHGWYKGISMNWIKGPITSGISFATYDFIKDWLQKAAYKKAID